MYYSQIRIDPNNDQRIWQLAANMYNSDDGGKTWPAISATHPGDTTRWDLGNSITFSML